MKLVGDRIAPKNAIYPIVNKPQNKIHILSMLFAPGHGTPLRFNTPRCRTQLGFRHILCEAAQVQPR